MEILTLESNLAFSRTCAVTHFLERVIFEYDGPIQDSVVEKSVHACATTPSFMEPAKVFSNLPPDCQPIAVKWRRYNASDRDFINKEIV